MSDKNWTPGSWNIADGKTVKVGDTMHYVCSVESEVNQESYRGQICGIQSCDHIKGAIHIDEAESNARLIAAAPDLYEALENLLGVVYGVGGTKPNAQRLAKKALSKARGETE